LVTAAAPIGFKPQFDRLECAAFSLAFKCVAVAVVSAALAWTWKLWANGVLEVTLASSGWLGAALCMMLYTVWFILRGTTVMDAIAIRQSWVWGKRVVLSELAYAKLIRLRGLDWLIAPRLYTKTFSNKLAVFYAADPIMLGEFERLADELKARRLQL
jgi:hypothetical protein